MNQEDPAPGTLPIRSHHDHFCRLQTLCTQQLQAPSPNPGNGAKGALGAPELSQSRDPVTALLFPFIG